MDSFLSKSQQIREGVARLEHTLEACEQFGIDSNEIQLTLLNARKIQYLRDLANTQKDHEAALADLKKKLSSLSKLYIVQKVPQSDRIKKKPLLAAVTEMMSHEGIKTQKELQVPEYFVCPVAGDLMTEPVLFQSGQTYERSAIIQHFDACEEKAEQQRKDEDSDFDEERIYTCPVTGQAVDRNMILPNKRIKDAMLKFMKQQPWAYDFDPRVKYQNIGL